MTRTRRIAAIAAVLLVVAAAVCWQRLRVTAAAPAATPTVVPAVAPAATAPAEDGDVAVGAGRARAAADLPALPANTPANVVVATLRARADAGDSRAACRIAITLLACREAALVIEGAAERANEPADPAPEPFATEETRRAVEDMDLRMLAVHESCQAVAADVRARETDYLTMAARAGEPEAMIRYIDGHHLFGRASHDFLAHPGFDAWRRDAPAMLQRLLRAGEPEAAYLLMVGTTTTFNVNPLAGLIPDDGEASLAYQHLLSRLGSGAEPRASDGLDTRAQQHARELAAQWHREYFGGRRFDGDSITRRLTPTFITQDGDSRVPCGE